MHRLIAASLGASFLFASAAFAKEADEGRRSDYYGTDYTYGGVLPPAKSFHQAMAEYNLNPNYFPRMKANWNAVGSFVLGVLAARYIEKGADKLEDLAWKHFQKASKSLSEAQSRGEREIMVEIYRRTGDWDYVGESPIDNTATFPTE